MWSFHMCIWLGNHRFICTWNTCPGFRFLYSCPSFLCVVVHKTVVLVVLVNRSRESCFLLSLDFPGETSGRCAAEQASPLLWKNRSKRRRPSQAAENYSEQVASEADIDSDSGYCSPKHNLAAGVTQRTAEHNTAAPTVCWLCVHH